MNIENAICSQDLDGGDYEPTYSCDDCGIDVPSPGLCPECTDARPRERLTRMERLQAMADRGCDTWAEYRGER